MDSPDQLTQRRLAAGPQDQLSGLVFNGVLELAKAELGPEAAQTVREQTQLPKRLVPFLKYPIVDFLVISERLARALLPKGRPFAQTMELIGHAGTRAFFESPVGQTLRALNGGNVHRMGAMAHTAYRTVYSYGERSYEKTGDQSARLHYQGDFMGPAIQAGVIQMALGKMNDVALNIRPTDVQRSGLDFVLEISW